MPVTKEQKRHAIGTKRNVSRLGAECTAALGNPAKSVPCLCRDCCAARPSAQPATLLCFRADEAVRCIGHRSVLHQPTQRASQAIAACCVFRGRMQSFSVHPSLMSHFMLFELAREHVSVPNHYSTEVQFSCFVLHRSSLRVSCHPDLQLVNQRSWLMRSVILCSCFCFSICLEAI